MREDDPIAQSHPTAVETNGIVRAPSWIGWVTISPKTMLDIDSLKRANEVKILYGMFPDDRLEQLEGMHNALYLQPMERNGYMNVADCVKFINKHPQWRLSVQWHKLIGVR